VARLEHLHFGPRFALAPLSLTLKIKALERRGWCGWTHSPGDRQFHINKAVRRSSEITQHIHQPARRTSRNKSQNLTMSHNAPHCPLAA
jgi:hypothetical protein